MNHVISYTLAIFIILIAIPLILLLWNFAKTQTTTKYSYSLRLNNAYFYINNELIVIKNITIYKRENYFNINKDDYDNTVYVKEKDLFNVPDKYKKNRLVKSFSKKGLHHDILRKIEKCTKVVIKYGNKTVAVEKII